MSEIITALLIFFTGLATGFFDSVIGAGGLISIPALVFLGLPPQVETVTDRFGTIGQSFTAFLKFWKAKKIVWKYVFILAVISLAGSLIGANILISIFPLIIFVLNGIITYKSGIVLLVGMAIGGYAGAAHLGISFKIGSFSVQ